MVDIRIVRKPNFGNARVERLKITLPGSYDIAQKRCQILSALAFIEDHGRFTHAGATDFYLSLIDPDGHPLSRFPDGTLISDHLVTVRAPYSSAADQYDPKVHIRIPVPW